MDSDGLETVALTVTAVAWRTAIDELDPLAERVVRAALDAGASAPWLKAGEVSLLLTDDQEIRSLNATYRARDRATNVLSFPGLDLVDGEAGMSAQHGLNAQYGPAVLGDIVMSVERLTAEAADLEKARIDHFAHLLVHGTLHLLGFDHDDDDRAAVMEALEAALLKALGFAAPYESVSNAPGGETAAMSAAS